jgi:hypothetical protein
MSRRFLVTFTLLAVVVVPACSFGGASTGAGDLAGDILATPTPTPLVAVGGGDTLPPDEFSVELELTYLLVPTVGTDQPVTFSTVIPLLPEFTSTNLAASSEGDILDDVTFTVGPVTAHNVADWIIKVDATLDPAMGAEPLSLHFDLKGQGYATIDEIVQLGAHMDVDAIAYEYSLTLPLEEGASKSFDVEGWKDIKEWMVVLHLK